MNSFSRTLKDGFSIIPYSVFYHIINAIFSIVKIFKLSGLREDHLMYIVAIFKYVDRPIQAVFVRQLLPNTMKVTYMASMPPSVIN